MKNRAQEYVYALAVIGKLVKNKDLVTHYLYMTWLPDKVALKTALQEMQGQYLVNVRCSTLLAFCLGL